VQLHQSLSQRLKTGLAGLEQKLHFAVAHQLPLPMEQGMDRRETDAGNETALQQSFRQCLGPIGIRFGGEHQPDR
tara:strand:+ start:470 stop:694 length:225 start_codon:yes stop_codon:yes gene_type:complete